MRNNFKSIVSMISVVLLLSALAFGQETNGSLMGTVKDQNNAVIPNATVKVQGVNVGYSRTYTTNADGVYFANQIPVGQYKVTVTSGSFQASTKDVLVTIGNTSTEDFTLGTSIGVSVDVTAGDPATTIDTSEAKVQTNITAAQIEQLPKGTSFASLLRTAASTRPNEPLSGQYQINGATGAENSFIVDGQEVSNFRTGALNGNNDIPFQSVRELQIKSSGFEAEYGGATGGVVNVVTKSGTNDLHGEFGVSLSTQKLNGNPRPAFSNSFIGSTATVGGIGTATANSGQFVEYLGQNKDAGVNFFPTASIGGAIVKDKLWFYGIYSPQYFEGTRVTNFVTGYPGNGAGRLPITAANFASTLPAYVRNQSPTQSAISKQTNEYGFFRLDASPSDKVRLTGSFTWNPIIQKGYFLGGTTVIGTPGFADFGGSIGYLAGSDLAARQGGRQNANNLRFEGVITPTSKSIIGLRYSRGFLNEKLNSYFIPDAPRIRCRTVADATLAAASGCVAGFQTNTGNFTITKDVSIRDTFDADYSYMIGNFGGRHDIKAGFTYSRISNDVLDGYKNTGVVNLCYSTTLTMNSTCGGYSKPAGITIPAPVAPAGQTQVGIGWIQRFATSGAAKNTAYSLYIQDKWQVNSRLTITGGLRAEKESLPAFNGQTTNLEFNFGEKLAPRVGVSYGITGDGKTKIAAFYGWFYDRLKFELPRGSFGGDFFRRDIFPIFGPIGTPAGSVPYTNFTVGTIIGNYTDPLGGQCPIAQAAGRLTLCNSDFRVPSNVTGLGAVDPNLKAFRQDEWTIEFQRELMSNSVLSVRYIDRNVAHAIEDTGYTNAAGSEIYIIANPGEGLAKTLIEGLGYQRTLKPERRYRALEFEYNSRFWKQFSFGLNYTYSRLRGNYSGLASSDEGGRLSPGVNRFFDQPWVGWTAEGKPDNGPLATDRPHVFKYQGTYSLGWRGSKSNSTDFTVFGFSESGIPITPYVDVFGILIPYSARGSGGRTPKYSQTDFSVTHKYKFGRDNRFGLAVDLNILNLFDQKAVLNVDNNFANPSWYELDSSVVAGSVIAATNVLTSTGVKSFIDAEIAPTAAGCQAYSGSAAASNFCKNQSYGFANAYQGPRNVRFGFRFIF